MRKLHIPAVDAPNPSALVVDENRVVHPTDPLAMAQYREELAQRVAELRGGVVQLESSLAALRAQLEQLPPIPENPEQPQPAAPEETKEPNPTERRRALEDQEAALAVELQLRQAMLAEHEESQYSFY